MTGDIFQLKWFNNELDYIVEKVVQNIKISDNEILETSLPALINKFEIYRKYAISFIELIPKEKLEHSLRVARSLVELKIHPDSIIATLLQSLEENQLKISEIDGLFGLEIAKLVVEIRKFIGLSLEPKNIKQAENLRQLIFTLNNDIRILIVKLVEMLERMRHIDHLDDQKKLELGLEALDIYAPLAGRIGFQQVKADLQEIGFSILYSNLKKSIDSKVKNAIKDDSIIDEIAGILRDILKRNGLDAEVYGRKKNSYSIWMKMKQKNISFEQLSDIVAFRVIVANQMDCYKGLGVIHSNYKMVPGTFQDFISMPKTNEYQSIHTTVIGPLQNKIEIQIRTKMMHEIAEFGIAAHWIYKEHLHDPVNKYEWVSDLLNIVDQSYNSEEFLHNAKLAIYYDQIFCFTPDGRIISLPKDGTVLDFAYSLDVNIGNQSTGAIINGVSFDNSHILNNGDQVKITTSPDQKPCLKWTDFVITGKARSSINQYLNKLNEENNSKKSILIPIQSSDLENKNLNQEFQALEEAQSKYNHINEKETKSTNFVSKNGMYLSKIRCVLKNEIDIIAHMIRILLKNHCRLSDIKMGRKSHDLFEFFLYIESHQVKQVDEIIDNFRNIDGIQLISRI